MVPPVWKTLPSHTTSPSASMGGSTPAATVSFTSPVNLSKQTTSPQVNATIRKSPTISGVVTS